MRRIGLDVHEQFCEVAIAEAGEVRSAGRVKTDRAELELFAQSLSPDDEVALEACSNALAIARILEPHVARVVIANTKALRQITHAKAKTDRLDARTLARLLASGFLEEVWAPDEATRALRRWIARWAALVRQRTRAKNEVHAVLVRTLTPKPPVTDVFGVRGRRWLAEQQLPVDEQVTLEGCLRQIAFLDTEIAGVERALAEQALGSPEIRRLMTVPGVQFITAATFMAHVGDSPASSRPGSWSATSGSTRASASPARSPRATGASQRKAPPKPATCSARPRGWPPEPPVRYAPSPSASRPGGAPKLPPSPSPASSPCCSGTCSPAARTTPTSVPR